MIPVLVNVLLAVSAFGNACGLMLVKKAAVRSGAFYRKLYSPPLLAGLCLMVLSPICMAAAARCCTISRMGGWSALSYVFILVLSAGFLHEKIDGLKIFGSLLIIAGILALK